METHIKHAEHNKAFYDRIVDVFPDNFHDWRIIVLFYIAIHCLKALSKKLGVEIGESHSEIESSINPYRRDKAISIKPHAYNSYRNLYQYSRLARYQIVTDIETFEALKKLDYEYALRDIRGFQSYIKSKGVDISGCTV
jgi:hypothetical protein